MTLRARERLTALVMAVAVPALAAAAAAPPSPHPQVASYDLDVVFKPVDSSLEGTAQIRFADAAPRDEIAFFLHGELEVTSITLGGDTVAFRQQPVFYSHEYSLVATEVTIQTRGLDLGDRLEVVYAGPMHPSRARSPSDYMRIDEDEVLLRAYGYSLWFPVFLAAAQDWYAADFSVTLRTPPELVSVFAGRLLERRQEDGLAVSRWQAPDLPLVAAQASARPWAVHRRGEIFVYSEADAESQAMAQSILAWIEDLERLFRAWYRERPAVAQMHILQMPPYGDISSDNVVGLTGGVWRGIETDANAKRTLAHELVHPFVQPQVTRSDPIFSLAIEGFPSYFHLPALAELEGEEKYEDFLDATEKRYLEKRQTGKGRRGASLPPEKPLLEITADELSIYKDTFILSDRALLFLDYLRRELGRDRFLDFTRELFAVAELSAAAFEDAIVRWLPSRTREIHRWLRTSDFPEEFARPRRGAH